MFYYLSLMKFDSELRFGLEYSNYEIIELENDYRILIPITKDFFDTLDKKFYDQWEEK